MTALLIYPRLRPPLSLRISSFEMIQTLFISRFLWYDSVTNFGKSMQLEFRG